jgi:hypothetical protein
MNFPQIGQLLQNAYVVRAQFMRNIFGGQGDNLYIRASEHVDALYNAELGTFTPNIMCASVFFDKDEAVKLAKFFHCKDKDHTPVFKPINDRYTDRFAGQKTSEWYCSSVYEYTMEDYFREVWNDRCRVGSEDNTSLDNAIRVLEQHKERGVFPCDFHAVVPVKPELTPNPVGKLFIGPENPMGNLSILLKEKGE